MAPQILTKCPTHGLLPTAQVCAKCYQSTEREMEQTNNLIRDLQKALEEVPKIIEELFSEGTQYKVALRKIAANELGGPAADIANKVLDGSSLRILARKGGMERLLLVGSSSKKLVVT